MAVWLAGCSANHVPVVDYYGGDRATYTVREGDTLYSIAWRHGHDYRELAKANDIDSGYTIYPGQEIRLDAAPRASRQAQAPPASSADVDESAQRDSPQPSGERPARASSGSASPPSSAAALDWRWPVNGSVLSSFDPDKPGRGGITIAGSSGDPVHAAEAGTVVYRGSGLTGYGKLIILKHDDHWLSAYAHNQDLLVSEGQQVDQGERIARMGATGTYRTQLRFEIRKDGQPQNPLELLPRE